MAMETKPGTLLKLTPDTSVSHFEQALTSGHVQNTCAHLLSLLCINKGVDNLPMPLLGNHVKTALIRMQAEEETGGLDNGKFVVARDLGNGKILVGHLSTWTLTTFNEP